MARLSADTVAELVDGTSPTAVGDATRHEVVAATLERLGIPFDRERLADADRIPSGANRAILLGMMAEKADADEARFLRREAERAAPTASDAADDQPTEEAHP